MSDQGAKFAAYGYIEAGTLFQLVVEAMTAIRNISAGRHCRLRWISEKDIAKYVNAIAEVAHNFHPRVPTDVIVAAYHRERQRAPEAFEMLPDLEIWVQTREQGSMRAEMVPVQIVMRAST